jgi:hypothetical protein
LSGIGGRLYSLLRHRKPSGEAPVAEMGHH